MTDHVYQRLRERLAYLKLPALAEQLAAALEQAEQEKPGYTRFLHDLLQVEVDATERRRLDGGCGSRASRRTRRWSSSTSTPTRHRPRLVEELATLRFVQEKANVLLIGPPGVGKTMLATRSGSKRCTPATASTTPPPRTSSPAPRAPRSRAAGRTRCASGPGGRS